MVLHLFTDGLETREVRWVSGQGRRELLGMAPTGCSVHVGAVRRNCDAG
jgi:hypothetical protein